MMKRLFSVLLLVGSACAQVPGNFSDVRIKGNVAIPTVTTGYHGTAGMKVQMSDGTGTAGNYAAFASDGSITNAAATPPATMTKYWSNGTQLIAGRAVGTVYTNTGSQRLDVLVTLYNVGAGSCQFTTNSAPHGTSLTESSGQSYTYTGGGGPFQAGTLTVPPNYDYEITTNCSQHVQDWIETTVGGLGAGGSSMIWPAYTGLAAYGGSNNWVTPTFGNVVSLFGSGTCSGYLKSDGTCTSGPTASNNTVTCASSVTLSANSTTNYIDLSCNISTITLAAPTANAGCTTITVKQEGAYTMAWPSSIHGSFNPAPGIGTYSGGRFCYDVADNAWIADGSALTHE